MAKQAFANLKTDFSFITQLDGPAESFEVILVYDTEFVKLRGFVVDWMRVFKPCVAQRRGRGTKQLLWEWRQPHLGEGWWYFGGK